MNRRWISGVPALLALTLVFSRPVLAGGGEGEGTTFGLKADMRWRLEVDDKDFNTNTDPGEFSFLRTRLAASLSRGDVSTFFQVQHPHQLDWNSSALATDNAVDVHQAYMKAEHFLHNRLSLKLGRMELKYGDERLVGAVGWSNIGRVFDGLVLRADLDPLKIDAFCTKQVERYTAGSPDNEPDDHFFGVWAVYKPLMLHLFALQGTAADTNVLGDVETNLSRTTAGIHYQNQYESGLGTILDAAYQIGTETAFGTPDVETDLAAWMFLLEVWYQLAGDMKPTFGAGVDWVSGDDPETAEDENFNNLYYTGHKFRGSMDYFVPTNPEGLRDIFIKLKGEPVEEVGVKLAVHNFSTSQNYPSAVDGSMVTAVGNEIDLEATFALKPELKLAAGIGYFIPAEDWKGKGADNGLWGYLTLQTVLGVKGP